MTLLVAGAAATLTPHTYTPLPVGSVTPKGWLLKQLTLQAEGLSGHLSQFWTDVMDSIWIGGIGDGGGGDLGGELGEGLFLWEEGY